jgi:hypothetical protein
MAWSNSVKQAAYRERLKKNGKFQKQIILDVISYDAGRSAGIKGESQYPIPSICEPISWLTGYTEASKLMRESFLSKIPHIELSLSSRKAEKWPQSIQQYIKTKKLSKENGKILYNAINGHRNIIIGGGARTGKKNLMRVLLEETATIFPEEIVYVLDHEIGMNSKQKNIVAPGLNVYATTEETISELDKEEISGRYNRLVLRELSAPLLAKWFFDNSPRGRGNITSVYIEKETVTEKLELLMSSFKSPKEIENQLVNNEYVIITCL